MGSGSLADFQALYPADVVNREAKNEPPDTGGTGPAAMYATAPLVAHRLQRPDLDSA